MSESIINIIDIVTSIAIKSWNVDQQELVTAPQMPHGLLFVQSSKNLATTTITCNT